MCPAAALATWTCDLNTHICTYTQHHIVTGQVSEQSACLALMQKDVCRERGTRSQADNEFQSEGGSWEAITAVSSTETHIVTDFTFTSTVTSDVQMTATFSANYLDCLIDIG